MSREDAIRKGQAAAALLGNADFIIAMDAVRVDAYRGWASTSPAEQAKREENYYLLQGVERLRDSLKALVDNARMEEFNAQREAEAEAKAKTSQEEDHD